ncbi:MAG: HAD-IA family hydrolase [Clostridiales bacterium]|nr:HAD-IA family hydrolase [Clostridiales bacterium]
MFLNFIWDFDGTLYDSYPHMAESFCKALSALGIDQSVADIMPFIKISMGTCMRHYKAKYNLGEELRELYKKFEAPVNCDVVRPFPGLEEALGLISSKGGKNYIYTHRNNSVFEYIRCYSLDKYFDDIITSEDNFPSKPAPDAILYLIEKHGLNKGKTIMMGDRDIDIQAAWNAGIKGCLFDPDNFYPDFRADYCIKSMSEIAKLL